MRTPSLENRVFFGLLLVTTLLFVWMVRGFLLPVFWAAVFAILFQPFYAWLRAKLGGRESAAAGLATLTVVVVVVVPSAMLITAVTRQALALYQLIQAGEVNLNAPIEFVQNTLPVISEVLARYGVEFDRLRAGIESAAVSGTQYIASRAIAFGQNALTTTILFVLTLYLLFFFFRDGERIIEGMIRALPMGDERERRLMGRFADVSRATVKGTLVVAVTQGTLGGIMFALLDIQAALFWGVIMGVLSLLPAVGPALVWAPAGVILLATGEIWRGLVIILGGALVIGLVDNLLRPTLVGRQTQMPDYLVLLATLGGLAAFGIAGFVAGPVIAALFLVMWEIFAEEYAPLDDGPTPLWAADGQPSSAYVGDGPTGGASGDTADERTMASGEVRSDGPSRAAVDADAGATGEDPAGGEG